MTIQDDDIAENPEEFFGNLDRVTLIDRVTVSPDVASVIITDNDGENEDQYFRGHEASKPIP